MKSPHSMLRPVLGLLVFGFLLAPRAIRADEPKNEPPAPAKESTEASLKPDAGNKDKASTDDPTKGMSAKELKKALKKYDANGNGILDGDELTKMKADQDANKNSKRNENAVDKTDLRATKNINHSIRQSQKGSRVVK